MVWPYERRIYLSAVGTLMVAGACGGDVDGGMETTRYPVAIRDSVGVVITEMAEPVENGIRWRVGDRPILTIGEDLQASAEYQFESINGAIRLPEGGVLVADGALLREYDEGGTHVRTWGRKGEGPGDFRFIGGVHRWGADSVVVWDRFPRRLTVFDTKGTLGRTTTRIEAPQLILRGVIGREYFVFERVINFDVNQLIANWNEREEYERLTGFIEVWDATGHPVSIIGPYPHAEYFTRKSPDRLLGLVRYSRNMITGVWGSLVIAGPNDTFELRAHRSDSELARIIRLDRPPVASGNRHRRALLEENPEDDPDIPMASTLPLFDRVVGDQFGHLWVRDYAMPGETTAAWTVFDSTGAIVTRLGMDNRLRVWEIGRDHILASQVDDLLGIESVVVLSLDRGETTSMDAPDNASISLNGSVPVVRCCRLSGLLVQPVVSEAAGPYGDPRIGSKSASQA